MMPSIERIVGRREFMQALGLGLVASVAPNLSMYGEEKIQANQEADKQQKEQSQLIRYDHAFTYPYAINGGFLIGLTCGAENPEGKRGLWKYSMEKGSLEKIADLHVPYSSRSGIESENEIPSFNGPWPRATEDGACAVLRIIQSSESWKEDFFHKENYLFLDVKNRRWYTPVDADDLLSSMGYFLPDTHLFLIARNYSSSKNPSKKRAIFSEFDLDTQTYVDFFNMPEDSLLNAFVTSSSRVNENGSSYQVYVLNLFDISRMAYQDRTKPGNPIHLTGHCKIGGMTDFFRDTFLTSDGRYLATNQFLFQLVGDNFESRINNLANAKIVLNFEGIRDCIGWNPTGELVAFKGEVPLVGRVGKIRYWYPEGYPETEMLGLKDIEHVRGLLEHGEKLEEVPYLSVFDRNGNVIHTEHTPWTEIQYFQWYDRDNILIVAQIKEEALKEGAKIGIKMINVKTGKKESLLEQIVFPKMMWRSDYWRGIQRILNP